MTLERRGYVYGARSSTVKGGSLTKSSHGALVVNNTACASVTAGAMSFLGAYNASKAAAASLAEVLRLELEPFDIRVVNLMTGAVR
jgi:NAD(P)-dependent dehydrogenase (short-subunit alcohol dehydrogenase family)